MYYIYVIRNKINDKVYVGLTRKSVEERFKGHINGAMTFAENDHSVALNNAIRAYGPENFYVEILEGSVSEDELNELEEYYINKVFHSLVPNGYNISPGGGQPKLELLEHDDEWKQNHSKLMTDLWASGEFTGFKGQHQTDKTKRKISRSLKGKKKPKRTKEHQDKINAKNRGRVQSEEERNMRSEAQLLSYANGNRKKGHAGGRKPYTEEQRIFNKENQIGKRWYHNDDLKLNLTFYKPEINKGVPDGWLPKRVKEYEILSRERARNLDII